MIAERWQVPAEGVLIAICGLDGSGKTTQARLLEERLAVRRPVYRTRPVTENFRQDPTLNAFLDHALPDQDLVDVVPELVLFSAMDRLRHMRTAMLPRLREGAVVISDRYVFSSYAWMVARGIPDLDWVAQLNRYLPAPDLTVYLDIPPELAVTRIRARGDVPRWEELDRDRMAAVRANFLAQEWGRSPDYHILDGQLPIATIAAEIGRLADTVVDRKQVTGRVRAAGSQ